MPPAQHSFVGDSVNHVEVKQREPPPRDTCARPLFPCPWLPKATACAHGGGGGGKLVALLRNKHTCNTAMLLLCMPTSRAAPTEILQAVTSCWLSFGVLSSHGSGPQGAQAVEKLLQPCEAAPTSQLKEGGRQPGFVPPPLPPGDCTSEPCCCGFAYFPLSMQFSIRWLQELITPEKKKVRNAQQCAALPTLQHESLSRSSLGAHLPGHN